MVRVRIQDVLCDGELVVIRALIIWVGLDLDSYVLW